MQQIVYGLRSHIKAVFHTNVMMKDLALVSSDPSFFSQAGEATPSRARCKRWLGG